MSQVLATIQRANILVSVGIPSSFVTPEVERCMYPQISGIGSADS
jgi:hypothetical protein